MLEKKLLINKTSSETRIALLENGRLAEIFIEKNSRKSVVGNIYKGIVVRVLPGMNSAFIDIGLEKAAFLYGGDTYSSEDGQLTPTSLEEEKEGEEKTVAIIQNNLKAGQEIIVQIAKEPIGTKGPRVTMHPTLAGRYLVLMPYTPYTALSRKIVEPDEKARLTQISEKLYEENKVGVIVRTSAQGISKEPVCRDFYQLKKNWDSLCLKINNSKSPSLLYSELDLTKKIVRDFFDTGISSIIVDHYNTYQELRSFLSENISEAFKCLKLYNEKIPLFDIYGIEVDIARALRRKIELPSGGYLVIDQTEALTAFDVNTGKYVGKANAQETILTTNKEAAVRVVEQLRLRNIGGIIIIDFIDMESTEDQKTISDFFADELKNDRALTKVFPVNELGLVQLTRKRTIDSLEKKLLSVCPFCEGQGSIKSIQTESLDLLREITRQSLQKKSKHIKAYVRSDIYEWTMKNEKKLLKKICDDLEIEIEFIDSKINFDFLRQLPFEVITDNP